MGVVAFVMCTTASRGDHTMTKKREKKIEGDWSDGEQEEIIKKKEIKIQLKYESVN